VLCEYLLKRTHGSEARKAMELALPVLLLLSVMPPDDRHFHVEDSKVKAIKAGAASGGGGDGGAGSGVGGEEEEEEKEEEEVNGLEEIKQCCAKVLSTLSHVLAPALRIVTLELMEPLTSLATVNCGCHRPASFTDAERRHLVAKTMFELSNHDEPLLRQLVVEEGGVPVLNLLAVPEVLDDALAAEEEAQVERDAKRAEVLERERAAEAKIRAKEEADEERKRRRKEVTQHTAVKGGAMSGMLGHAMVGNDTDSDDEWAHKPEKKKGGESVELTDSDDESKRAETPLGALYDDADNELMQSVETAGEPAPGEERRKADAVHGKVGAKLELALVKRDQRLQDEAQHANVSSVPVLVAGALHSLAAVPGVRIPMLGDGCMRSMGAICTRGLKDIQRIYEVVILDQTSQAAVHSAVELIGGGDVDVGVAGRGIERLARAMCGVAGALHELVGTKRVATEAANEGGLHVLTQLMTAGMEVRRLMSDQQQKVARSKARVRRLGEESTRVRREAMALQEAGSNMEQLARAEKDAVLSEPMVKQATAMAKRSNLLVQEAARLGGSVQEEEANLERQKQRLERLEEELQVEDVEETRKFATSALFRLVSHAVPGAIPHLQNLVDGQGSTPTTWRLCAHALLDLARHGTASSGGPGVRSTGGDDAGDDGEGKSPSVGVPAVHILSLLAARPDDQTRLWAAEALLELSKVCTPPLSPLFSLCFSFSATLPPCSLPSLF
jgi:hypothetical protein